MAVQKRICSNKFELIGIKQKIYKNYMNMKYDKYFLIKSNINLIYNSKLYIGLFKYYKVLLLNIKTFDYNNFNYIYVIFLRMYHYLYISKFKLNFKFSYIFKFFFIRYSVYLNYFYLSKFYNTKFKINKPYSIVPINLLFIRKSKLKYFKRTLLKLNFNYISNYNIFYNYNFNYFILYNIITSINVLDFN